MSTSTTAWTWYAMDFSQGELVAESFAVRFKTEDTATLFKQKFEECQAALKKTPATKSASTVATTSVTAVSAPVQDVVEKANDEEEAGEVDEVEEEEAEDEEDQNEEEYEDVEESIMFEKRCTLSFLEGGAEKTWMLLGTGNMKIVYDEEMLCGRIVVENVDDQLLCDNVIAIETQLKVFVD